MTNNTHIIEAVKTEAVRRARTFCGAARPNITRAKAATLRSLQIKAFTDTDNLAFEASLFSVLPKGFECNEADEAEIVAAYTEAGVAEVNKLFDLYAGDK